MNKKNYLREKKKTLLSASDNEACCMQKQIEDIDKNLHRAEIDLPPADRVSEEAIGRLMDMLHLSMLHLIEAQISQQLTLEMQTATARLILARNRLQQGIQPQLPVHTPYLALSRLLDQGLGQLTLLRFDVEPARGLLRPITQIFGRLVPHCFRRASLQWERCVEQIVECANLQRELQTTFRSIERLKWMLHRRRLK